MNVRKLNREEHGMTRCLWEEVFPEDSKEFLDYYYFIKTQDNVIYVLEEDSEIRSMLHLNPYMLQIENNRFLCHYVVAVSTKEQYRRRGYFQAVLKKAFEDLYTAKAPISFLMPASEAIYLPYGYRSVYQQVQAQVCGVKENGGAMFSSLKCRDACLSDAAGMAAFFEQWYDTLPVEKKYQMYAVRDEKYYQRAVLEQQSENGGIRLVYCEGQLAGMFLYSEEGELEILEPLFLPEYEKAFFFAVQELTGDEETPVKCFAYSLAAGILEKEKIVKRPVIMVRILHLESLLRSMKVREGEQIDCSFAVIDTLCLKNNKIWRVSNDSDPEHLTVRETEDSQGVLTIEALTDLLFGCRTPEEIAEDENVIFPIPLRQELSKLKPLNRLFLNEIV